MKIKLRPEDIGARLRYYRQRAGFSQTKLGHRAGCAQNTICGYEREDRQIDASFLVKRILPALGVKASTFFRGVLTVDDDG